MGAKPRVLVVGDSWGAVGLPALTAAGVEFVFLTFTGILVTSQWSLPLLPLRSRGRARRPQFLPRSFAQSRRQSPVGQSKGQSP